MFCCFGKKPTNKKFSEMSSREIAYEVNNALDTNNLNKFKQILASGWSLDNLPYRRSCWADHYFGEYTFINNYIDYYPIVSPQLLNYMLLHSKQQITNFPHKSNRLIAKYSLSHMAFLENNQHFFKHNNVAMTVDSLKDFLHDYQLTPLQIEQSTAAIDYFLRKNKLTPETAEGIRDVINSYKMKATPRP